MNIFVSCFLFRRNKPRNFHYSFQQRAAMNRKDSEESIMQRDRSVKDISRSEKQYLNIAYDENCDVSDDEGQQFMVQVDLGKPRSKKPATVSSHIEHRYRYSAHAQMSLIFTSPCRLMRKKR